MTETNITNPLAGAWTVDCATTVHVTNDVNDITNPMPWVERVRTTSGHAYTTHQGMAVIGGLTLSNVVVIPSSPRKLISWGTLEEKGAELSLKRDISYIVMNGRIIPLENQGKFKVIREEIVQRSEMEWHTTPITEKAQSQSTFPGAFPQSPTKALRSVPEVIAAPITTASSASSTARSPSREHSDNWWRAHGNTYPKEAELATPPNQTVRAPASSPTRVSERLNKAQFLDSDVDYVEVHLTLTEALNSKDTEMWAKAKDREIDQLEQYVVFEWVDRVPKGQKVIDIKWVRKEKEERNDEKRFRYIIRQYNVEAAFLNGLLNRFLRMDITWKDGTIIITGQSAIRRLRQTYGSRFSNLKILAGVTGSGVRQRNDGLGGRAVYDGLGGRATCDGPEGRSCDGLGGRSV